MDQELRLALMYLIEGADNDFAVAVVPPAQDHAPPVQGVPRDDGNERGAGFAGEGCV